MQGPHRRRRCASRRLQHGALLRKILERHGISVTTVDLSEILGAAAKLGEADKRVVSKIDEIKAYANATAVPPAKLIQMARLGLVLDDFVAANHLDATAIQC